MVEGVCVIRAVSWTRQSATKSRSESGEGPSQVNAGTCELSSEMAENLDFILRPLRIEGELHDPLGEECIKWEHGSRKFMQETILVIQVQSDGG